MKDFHPLVAAWRFVQPFLFGQVHTNKRAISAHYDIDPIFFLSFLDPETPCYTQGVYDDPNEQLSTATLRKFKYCFEKLELKPGDHGARGFSTPRNAAFVAPASATRRRQSAILTAAPSSLASIGS